jgi:hypothetical protein
MRDKVNTSWENSLESGYGLLCVERAPGHGSLNFAKCAVSPTPPPSLGPHGRSRFGAPARSLSTYATQALSPTVFSLFLIAGMTAGYCRRRQWNFFLSAKIRVVGQRQKLGQHIRRERNDKPASTHRVTPAAAHHFDFTGHPGVTDRSLSSPGGLWQLGRSSR